MKKKEKEISEWSNSDLCQWLLSKNYRGISDLCKSTGLNGYDIFYITDAILKDEFQIKKFHERQSFIRCISQLISEHCIIIFNFYSKTYFHRRRLRKCHHNLP